MVEREEKIARHMFVHLLKEETGICTLQDGPLKPSFLLHMLFSSSTTALHFNVHGNKTRSILEWSVRLKFFIFLLFGVKSFRTASSHSSAYIA